MSIERSNDLGLVNISTEAVASLVGGVVTECYGVVGMASQKIFKDGIAELLKKENFTKGVIVKSTNDKLELDLYIIVGYGVKISQVVNEVQKKVKYEMKRGLELEFDSINIYVQGVKVSE